MKEPHKFCMLTYYLSTTAADTISQSEMDTKEKIGVCMYD